MISQGQILSTLAVDTPASTQQNGIRRRGAQEAPAATWLQSTRSPVTAARYADSISKGMDQRMQGMLQNRRRVSDVRGAVQSKQPPPPSTPPPPGQPNVSPTGTGGIKLALSGLSGASDSESLCLDISSKVDEWLSSSSPLEGASNVRDDQVPLTENGETLDFEQFQAWERQRQRQRPQEEQPTEKASPQQTVSLENSDEKTIGLSRIPPMSLTTRFVSPDAPQNPPRSPATGEEGSALAPIEALKQVRALAKETLSSLGMAQFEKLESQLAGLVMLCERGLREEEAPPSSS